MTAGDWLGVISSQSVTGTVHTVRANIVVHPLTIEGALE